MMPHSGHHFLSFWRVLVPKNLILGLPWRPAGHQMAPKIAQVSPKWLSKSSLGVVWVWSWKPTPRLQNHGLPQDFFTVSFWTDDAKINQKSDKICQESAKNQLVNDCT